MAIELSCVKLQTVEDDLKAKSDLSDTFEDDQVSGDLVSKSKQENSDQKDDLSLHRFECIGCGYVYDPEEGIKKFDIPAGTSFLDLDQLKFRCPVCRLRFDSYRDIGTKFKPSGFEENLGYGFGFNKLPSGQKNVLIFGSLALAAACFLSLYSLK